MGISATGSQGQPAGQQARVTAVSFQSPYKTSHETSESPKRALALDLVRRGIVGSFLIFRLQFDVLRATC